MSGGPNKNKEIKTSDTLHYSHLFVKRTFDILVHIFDDAGKRRHVLLCERHAQVVADEVVPRLQHWGGDKIENAGG